jgi:hypothetical protein
MSRIDQTDEELKRQFDQQLELLSLLAISYDDGSEVAAKAMATCVRILLHDTNRSTSLLGQLNMKNLPIFDTLVAHATRLVTPTQKPPCGGFASGCLMGFEPMLRLSQSRVLTITP